MADAFPFCKGISRSAIIGISVMLSKTDPDIRELWSEIRDKNLEVSCVTQAFFHDTVLSHLASVNMK